MPDFLPLFNSLFSLFQATLRPLIYHFLPTLLREDPKEKGICVYSPLLCALLLRLGDLLDFDSQRTPPILHKLINPQGISSEEWKKHFVIENTRKVKNDADVNLKKIVLYGSCDDPVIHRKILKYIDFINSEIQNAVFMTEGMDEPYRLRN